MVGSHHEQIFVIVGKRPLTISLKQLFSIIALFLVLDEMLGSLVTSVVSLR